MIRRFELGHAHAVIRIETHLAICFLLLATPIIAIAQQQYSSFPPNKLMSSFQFAGDPTIGETDSLLISVSSPIGINQGGKLIHVMVSRSDGLPFPQDADLEITLLGRRDYFQEDCIANHIPLEIKRGQMTASTKMITQTDVVSDSLYIKVWKNGKPLSGFGPEDIHSNQPLNMSAHSCITELLLVPKEKASSFAPLLGSNSNRIQQIGNVADFEFSFFRTFPTYVGNLFYETSAILEMSEELLGANWLEISSSGSVTIRLVSYLALDQERQRVLRQYVQGGGVLILTDVAAMTNESLAPVIGSAPFQPIYVEISDDILKAAATRPNLTDSNSRPTLASDIFSNQSVAGTESIADIGDSTLRQPASQGANTEWNEKVVALLDYGMGKIVVTSKSISDLTVQQVLTATQNSTLPLRSIGNRGVNAWAESGDSYWNWQIPEVSRSPVGPFVLWIVLFSAIVGPGLIWYSRRSGRRALLIVVFPAIAFFFTSVIFISALAQEGLGTRCRIRSLTWYDAKRDEGFSWSRQTYFSGWPPSEMRVGPETEVVRMLSSSIPMNRKVVHAWRGDQQVFLNVLAPREQSQFLIRHPVKSLKLFEAQASSDPIRLEVRNTSGVHWSHALFRHEGQFFYASEVASGATISMQYLTDENAIDLLRKLWQESVILLERQDIKSYSVLDSWSTYSRHRHNHIGGEPLMEILLARSFSSKPPLQDRNFLLMLDDAPFLDRGFQVSKESKGVHCVEGIW